MTDDMFQQSVIETLIDKWRRRKWLILIIFSTVLGVIGGLTMALPPLYMSSTTLLFGQDSIAKSYVREPVPNELELRLGIVRQAVMSRAQLQEIIDTFDLYPALRATMPPQSVINRMSKDIDIVQQASSQPQWGQNSNYIITISYRGWDPELTARVANDLAARYETESERLRTTQAIRTTEFIQEQLAVAKAQFEIQEKRINDFKNEHMGELPEQQQINLATLERLNSELRLNGEKQIQLLTHRNELIFGAGSGDQPDAVTGLSGALKLDRLKRELTELKTRYTENYPGVIRLENEIRELALALENAPQEPAQENVEQFQSDPIQIDLNLQSLKQEEKALRASISELVARIEHTPKIDQQLKRFANDYEATRDEYLSLQKSLQDARLAESLETQKNQQVKIMERAIAPDFPVGPNRMRLLVFGFMAAIGFAGAAVVLAEQMNSTFHTVADIRRFTRVPVLANIPEIHTIGGKLKVTMRSILLLVLITAVVIALSWYSYSVGKTAEQLVLLISG